MRFCHAISAHFFGGERKELMRWGATVRRIYIDTTKLLGESAYTGYITGSRQYSPRPIG